MSEDMLEDWCLRIACENSPQCKRAHDPGTAVAWQKRTNSAKSATAPTPKASNYVLSADFPCENTKHGTISYGYGQNLSGKP